MRCIFHKGSRKVDDVNSIPRPRVINRDGGKEYHPACIAVPFEVLRLARKESPGQTWSVL